MLENLFNQIRGKRSGMKNALQQQAKKEAAELTKLKSERSSNQLKFIQNKKYPICVPRMFRRAAMNSRWAY